MNKETYSHVLPLIELEVDWPHLSWATGYLNDTTTLTPGPSESIYKKMKRRNRCVHRDYQNIAYNGARTSPMIKVTHTLHRNQSTDHPLLLFYALVGNDV